MNKLCLFLLFTFIVYGQQQVKIPWPSLADSPWPVLRGDMQGTGRSEFIGPRTNNVHWRKDMPLGIFHGPVIGYNDDLFVGSRAYTGFSGDTTNYFYSLDKNGDNLWTFLTDNLTANVAGPTVAVDGTVYFSSIAGGLYAINPDGTLKWNNKRFTYTYYTRFVPLAKNNNIYLPFSNYLFILEPQNGNIIDSFYTPYISSTEVVFSVGGDTVYYFSGRPFTNDPKAINAMSITGENLWSIELYIYTHSWGTLVVDNVNRIYFYAADSSTNQFLYCVNPNGTINWKYQIDANEGYENYSSPTIDRNGNIIFQTSSQDSGYINSVNYYGEINWKTTLGHYVEDGAFINHGLVCDAEGKIYCGSSTGSHTNIWCIDKEGIILWKLDLEGYEYDTSPAIDSDGSLYIGTHLNSTFLNHVRNLIAVRDTVTSVPNDNPSELSYFLEQNFPNPFNSSTNIRYSIPLSDRVTIKVFDVMGKEVATLLDRFQNAGSYDVIFQADKLASGIFFYTLTSGNFMETKKLILLK
jgi:hypothetical protein